MAVDWDAIRKADEDHKARMYAETTKLQDEQWQNFYDKDCKAFELDRKRVEVHDKEQHREAIMQVFMQAMLALNSLNAPVRIEKILTLPK